MANFKLKKYVFIVRLFDKKPYLTQTEIMDAMREAFPSEDAPSISSYSSISPSLRPHPTPLMTS